jgi:DNA ligase (NAD+)
VITALGIEGVGSTIAATLADRFGTLEALQAATAEQLDAVEGIGAVLAQSIAAWFGDPYHQRVLDKLRAAGVNMAAERRALAGDSLAGKTVVLTGTLPTLTREQAAELIAAHGGKVSSSVSKKTSFVLVGDAPGSKADKARELGVPLVDEAAFRTMIGWT